MLDEPFQRIVKVAGGFAGLNQTDRGFIKNRGEVRQRIREVGAFTEPVPNLAAQSAQRWFLDALGKQSNRFPGGEPARCQIVQRLQKG